MFIKRRIIEGVDQLDSLTPMMQRIYAARGITELKDLEKGLSALLPFDDLKDIEKAANRLSQAIYQQQHILIIGDFDADGATSTALAVSALKLLGAEHVDFLVPNRFEFGYGLTPAIVEVAHQQKKPNLIVTVDNGINSIEGVNAARALGIDVLVTDHHLPGEQLPQAVAIVNPNQRKDKFASKSIAGVGVIFYVMLGLRKQLRLDNWFKTSGIQEPNMAQLLDLVALGTVADVVGLDQNNRIMVSQGLLRIRQGLSRPGIAALIHVSGREQSMLREHDLGFAVAPRLNAAGRLDDMALGIQCLLSHSFEEALLLANQLSALNILRRKIEIEMKEQAILALEHLSLPSSASNAQMPLALCLTHESWHQGVIGILAGRLKERYHRPVIAFAQISEHEWKGSARSIPELNIRDVLAVIDKDNPGLIIKFGGHAMAAGLSLHSASFSTFQRAFLTEVSKHIDASACQGELLSDGPLLASELNLACASELQEAGPWGAQFPEPLFDNHFEILDQRIVGQHHLKLTLRLEDAEDIIDAIAFNVNLSEWPNHRARTIHAAYKLDINRYRGKNTLQLVIIAMNVAPILEHITY